MKTINIIYINYNYLNIIHEVAKLSAVPGFPSHWHQGLELHATHRDTLRVHFLTLQPSVQNPVAFHVVWY